jgi:hypothetical protein
MAKGKLFRVTMNSPDGKETREIDLRAVDEDEARFLCESQARTLAAEEAGDGDYRDHLYKIKSVEAR